VAHVGLTPEFATAVAYLPAEANKTRFIKLGKPGYMRYADLEYDQRIPSGVRQREAMLCLAMLPILRQGEVIACLTLASHSSADISKPVRLVLEAVSEQLGAVISRLKVEHALSINKDHDKALLEAMPDFMFILDRQGRFLAAKPAIDVGFNTPAETCLGRHVGEVMPPNVATQILTMLRRTLETRQVQEFEYQLICEPGRTDFFEARMSAASADQAVTIVRNVTLRRQSEEGLEKHIHDLEVENQRLLEALANDSPD
jgi:PAS domain S-box-containing protein